MKLLHPPSKMKRAYFHISCLLFISALQFKYVQPNTTQTTDGSTLASTVTNNALNVTNIATTIAPGVTDNTSTSASNVTNDTSTPASNVTNDTSTPASNVTNDTSTPASNVTNDTSTPASNVTNDSSTPASNVTNDTSTTASNVTNDSSTPASNVTNDTSTTASNVTNDSSTPASNVTNDTSTPASNVTDNASTPASNITNDTSTPASNVTDNASTPASNITNDTSTPASNVTNDTSTPASKVTNDTSTPASNVTDNASTPASNVTGTASTPASKVTNDTSTPASNVTDNVSTPASNVTNDTSTPASKVTNDTSTPASNVTDTASTPASNVTDNVTNKVTDYANVTKPVTVVPTQPPPTTTPSPTTQSPCLNVKCQNGGKCVVVDGKPRCQCNANYTGDSCQYAVAFYTQWSAWGTCDSSCGDGLQKRTRNCTDVTGADRGQDCGVDVEEQKACVGLPKCVVTSNPCEADAGNPCVSDGVSHTCRLQAGGQFKCSCKDGFINDKAGKYCIDENECNRANNDCNDVNKKALKVGVASCRNTVGSYDCVCASGFKYNETTRACTDVDECINSNTHNCDIPTRATCTNTPGSFTCRCKSGFSGNGTTGTCKENRLLSFAGHTKLGSSAQYSPYFTPNYALKVGNYLYPSFYFTRGGLLLFTTVTYTTVSTGVRRDFTNPTSFSLDASFQEKAAFAPWWSNMITGTDADSGIYYKEFSADNSTDNIEIQAQKSDFTKNYAGASISSPKYMIVITWNKMEQSKEPRVNSETVTFQVVMITDYVNTYAKVIYNDREMTWDVLRNSVKNYPVRIGLLKQNETAEEYPQSYLNLISSPEDQDRIQRIDDVTPTSLTGDVKWPRKGFFYYKISGSGGVSASSHPGLVCSTFLTNKKNELQNSSFSVKKADVSKCPPSASQLTDSLKELKIAGIPSSMTCYAKRSALSSTATDERTPRCCYDNANKGLITDPSVAKGFNIYMVRKPTSKIQTEADTNYGVCCDEANRFAAKEDLCSQYTTVLPVCSSKDFVASGAGGALGDPHLTTLDGLSFTFNGHGEFILLKATNVQVQGRFSPQRNAAGVKSATFISGIAGQQSSPSSDKVEFRLNAGATDAETLKNGVVQNVDLSSGSVDWSQVTVKKTTDNKNISTWKMIFSEGLTAGVQLTNGMFQLVIDAGGSYRGNLEGLLGNFDGNTTNDFKAPNGDILAADSVEKDIYTYGKKWQNTNGNTLFTYGGSPNNTDWNSHIDTAYTPVFFNANLTVMFPDSSKRSTAISLCNSGKSTDTDPVKRKECYFDFKVTENAALASSTSDTKAALAETQSALANFPPEIKNGNVTIEVSVGGNFSLVLIAEDQNEGDSISFFLNDDAPSGLSISNETKTLTWTGVPDSNSMSIKVTVSDGKAKSLWIPKIKLCKCKNGATCGFNVESSEPFFIVPCTCLVGYDGTYCENDMDGCASGPCFPGVDCKDVLARDLKTTPAGFTCGSCPSHLVGNGITCSDKDECVVNKPPPCQQTCTNIANGYVCSCSAGYTLGADLSSCVDNNECLLKTDKCNKDTTTCTNTVGAYTCECKKGYTRDSDYACADINECSTNPCPANSRCQNTVGSYTCTCNFGYQLNTETKQCEDKDECAGSNNCQQKCVDGVGTYTCACNTGYKLNTTDLISCLPETECTAQQRATCDGGSGRASCAVSNGDVYCSCPSGFALNSTNYCIDINECTAGSDICVKSKSDCVNSAGGYKCQCKNGYSARGDFLCEDIDECKTGNNCTSPATCSNTEGSYTCVCPSGYTKSGQYGCTDINECASSATHSCDKEHGTCHNTPGGYTCSCNKGFTGTGFICADLNECSTGNNCSQTCSNTIGSYTCSCISGYKLDADKFKCSDVNECADSAANGCYSNAYCTNTPGGYTCSCPKDYRLKGDGKTCESIYKCADNHGCSHTCGRVKGVDTCSCPSGMELDNTNKTCVDTNECASSSTNNCKLENNVVCVNTNGSYVCNCVNSSYVKSQDSVCVDADECILKMATCPANSQCFNTDPGYECRCLSGYQKQGSLCNDVNECSGANDCHPTLSTCNNSPGGYSCACKTGYSGDGRTCSDIDECSLNTHDCDSRSERRTCTNTPGSFTCGCQSGYQLAPNKKTCNDVDECAGSHGCAQKCKNTPGGFECECQAGYKLAPDQKNCVVEAECSTAKKATCLNQQCAKVNGTETCQCPSGFTLHSNGTSCIDINECLSSPCYPTNSSCENLNGGYNCSCINGFILGPNNVCKDRNGGLSLWSNWGKCSKACGTGTRSRSRTCDNPTREGFGADCSGPRSESQDCNKQLCPPNEVEKTYGIILQFNGLPVSYFTVRVQGEFRTTVASGINNYCNTDNANLRKCCSSNSTYVPNTSTPKAYTEVGKIAIANGYPRDNAGVAQVMIVVKSDKSNALCSASKKRKKRGISLGGSEIAIPQAILADIMADPTISSSVVSKIVTTVKQESNVTLTVSAAPSVLVKNDSNELSPLSTAPTVQPTTASNTNPVTKKEGTAGWVAAVAVIFSLIGIIVVLLLVFIFLSKKNMIPGLPGAGKGGKDKEKDEEIKLEEGGKSSRSEDVKEEEKTEEKGDDKSEEKEEEKGDDKSEEKEEGEGTSEGKEEEKAEEKEEEKPEEKEKEEEEEKTEEKKDEEKTEEAAESTVEEEEGENKEENEEDKTED
uniref:Uncharacterized protein LOC111108065 n=1 Tax=Crassostrea virginica TaxID=6565 RepID=A0A8B8B982_CRAVI|nr:uncharacterized protein LOC111108065 [Crassostrea virginica]